SRAIARTSWRGRKRITHGASRLLACSRITRGSMTRLAPTRCCRPTPWRRSSTLLLKRAFSRPPPAGIATYERIDVGASDGAGSADAATLAASHSGDHGAYGAAARRSAGRNAWRRAADGDAGRRSGNADGWSGRRPASWDAA